MSVNSSTLEDKKKCFFKKILTSSSLSLIIFFLYKGECFLSFNKRLPGQTFATFLLTCPHHEPESSQPRSHSFMMTRKSLYLSRWKKIKKTEHKSIRCHWTQMSCAQGSWLFLLLPVCLLHLILSSFLSSTTWKDPISWLDRWWKWLDSICVLLIVCLKA